MVSSEKNDEIFGNVQMYLGYKSRAKEIDYTSKPKLAEFIDSWTFKNCQFNHTYL